MIFTLIHGILFGMIFLWVLIWLNDSINEIFDDKYIYQYDMDNKEWHPKDSVDDFFTYSGIFDKDNSQSNYYLVHKDDLNTLQYIAKRNDSMFVINDKTGSFERNEAGRLMRADEFLNKIKERP